MRGCAYGVLFGVLAAIGCDGGSDPDPGVIVIASRPAAMATEDVEYVYAPETDGAVPVTAWSLAGEHSCGGTIDVAGGTVRFTVPGPVPPDRCTLAVTACAADAAIDCATQRADVAIEAVDDPPSITTTAPTTADEDLEYRYEALAGDPDGLAPSWSLAPGHTCGGGVTASTGVLTFTPAGPAPPPTCQLAITVCSRATACDLETAVVTIAAVNDPPAITPDLEPIAVEDEPYVHQLMAVDGDSAVARWYLLQAHTCGGSIDQDGSLSFTIAGPVPPASCDVAVEACDDGVPVECGTLTTTIGVQAVDDAPVAVDDTFQTLQGSVARRIDVLANDLDADAGPRIVAAVSAPANGAVQIETGGTAVRYAPAAGYCNSQPGGVRDTFTYQLMPGGAVATVAVRVMCPGRAVEVSAGEELSCARFDNGVLRCWGWNGAGQLGLGDTVSRGGMPGQMGANLPPVDVGSGRGVAAIAAGMFHACAILDDGSVKCWGANSLGQLGLGDTAARGDQAGEMGDALPRVDLGTGRTAVAIAVGLEFSCAILDDGSVKCWGQNDQGQLGQGHTATRGDQPGEMGDALPRVELGTGRRAVRLSIALGYVRQHVCAVLDDASIKCWGNDARAALGVGPIGTNPSLGDQPGEMGDNLPAVALGTGATAVDVAAGESYSCALLADGRVKCWGESSAGELGIGIVGVIGDQPGELGDSLAAVALGTGRTAVSLKSGNASVCAVLDDASVKCWGYNNAGRLGLGDTASRGDQPGEMGDALPAVPLGTGRSVVALTAGFGHHCVILDDATIKCWGAGTSGALGLGSVTHRGDQPGEMGDALPIVAL